MKQRRLKAAQAQELGLTLYARWQFDDLPRRALEELGDALLVWAGGDVLDEITRRALSLVWTPGLERDVRDCIVELEAEERYADITARALYELDTDHGRASSRESSSARSRSSTHTTTSRCSASPASTRA
jgi:hypothetical protein